MNPQSVTIVMLLGLAAGCTAEESGAQLLVPNDIALHWDESFNGVEDGLGALVPIDLMVYDGQSGEPMSWVELELEGRGDTTLAMPFQVAISIDSNREEGAEWDAYRDQYFHFVGTNPSEQLSVQTDADGLARVYVYVDAFRRRSRGYTPASVLVSSTSTEELFYILPQ